MGEAKRRKQLGLAPSVFPFVAEVGSEKQVTLLSGPSDPARREQLLSALRKVLAEINWARTYRHRYVMSGMAEKLLRTAADVEAIEVPPHRRVTGELLENYEGRSGEKRTGMYTPLDSRSGERGTWLHHDTEFSFDGKTWERFPEPEHPLEGFSNLMQHPVSEVRGELVRAYTAETGADGTVTFEPEPPAVERDALTELLREWHGTTPETWAELFYEAQDIAPEDEEDFPVPTAIRMQVELRAPAPMPGPMDFAVASVGGLDVHFPHEQRTYTTDGQNWLPYEKIDAAPDL